jgi:hypothetical protein
MAMTVQVNSAELLLREDLEDGEYAAGADRGYWRLVELTWPHAIFEVAAAPRENAPSHYAFRFDLTGYPQAPTAAPWNLETGDLLPGTRWPAGGLRVNSAFNPGWRGDAIYVPMDRLAISGHHDWPTKYAARLWDPARGIVQYLQELRTLLNDPTYTGVRGG